MVLDWGLEDLSCRCIGGCSCGECEAELSAKEKMAVPETRLNEIFAKAAGFSERQR